tara:strand:- start:8032 stop:8202 length:171 start_codon:yes stop_codon:yes gene_type:complete
MSKEEDRIKEMERIIEESFNIMSDEAMYDEFFKEEIEISKKPKDNTIREKKKNDKE